MSQVLLVGVDGSPSSLRAAEFAADRVRSVPGASVVVAHVIDWSRYRPQTAEENEVRHVRRQEEIDHATKNIVQPVVDRFSADGTAVTSVVRHGHPAQGLIDLAQAHDAAHLVVGRTGESRLQAMFFGSVPSTLVQISPIPVTVVP